MCRFSWSSPHQLHENYQETLLFFRLKTGNSLLNSHASASSNILKYIYLSYFIISINLYISRHQFPNSNIAYSLQCRTKSFGVEWQRGGKKLDQKSVSFFSFLSLISKLTTMTRNDWCLSTLTISAHWYASAFYWSQPGLQWNSKWIKSESTHYLWYSAVVENDSSEKGVAKHTSTWQVFQMLDVSNICSL